MVQFANERRRGWEEAPDSPERAPQDAWDQGRNARLCKRQPGGEAWLGLASLGWAGGEFGVDQAVDGLRVEYWLERDGDLHPLESFQWADWDRSGTLLAATRDGRLQRLRLTSRGLEVLFEADLARLEPDPAPAPDWASSWY